MNTMEIVDNTGKPHSGLGITSFVLALLTWLVLLLCFLVAGVSQMSGDSDESAGMIGAGLGLIFGLILGLTSLCLGIVCVLQADRKKIFGVLGIVLTLLGGLAVAGLMVAGAMFEESAPAGTVAPAGN